MKSPGFLPGVAQALVISLVGSVVFSLVKPYLGTDFALRLLIALSALTYGVFLLRDSPVRVGLVTTVALWSLVSGVVWLIPPGLFLFLLAHMGLIWLLRCCYCHQSLLAVLLDAGLQGASLVAALWALQHTGSVMLSLWCFFLVQALFVIIPDQLSGASDALFTEAADTGFQRAHRSAESALRRLSQIS